MADAAGVAEAEAALAAIAHLLAAQHLVVAPPQNQFCLLVLAPRTLLQLVLVVHQKQTAVTPFSEVLLLLAAVLAAHTMVTAQAVAQAAVPAAAPLKVWEPPRKVMTVEKVQTTKMLVVAAVEQEQLDKQAPVEIHIEAVPVAQAYRIVSRVAPLLVLVAVAAEADILLLVLRLVVLVLAVLAEL